MDWAFIGSLLYDNIVIGVFGTPILFALLGVFPALYWALNKVGMATDLIMVVLGFVGLTYSAGGFLSNASTVAYLPGWVYGLILVVSGFIIWLGLNRKFS